MSDEDDFAANSVRQDARAEIEQHLLGRILRGDPGALEFASELMRHDAPLFLRPHDRIMSAIYREIDAGRTVTAAIIAAEMPELNEHLPVGILEYLRSMAEAAPASISPAGTHKQMLADMRAWRRLHGRPQKAGSVELVRGDAVDPEAIDWIWPGWLAAGKLHILGGQAGTGKTTLAIAIAATLSNGGVFPDGTRAPVGDTLIWSGEDAFRDSILPRFIANGGVRDRIHFVNGRHDENGVLQDFDPAWDVDALLEAASSIRMLRLNIIDPVVSAVLGDSHKNAEVRRAMQPLVRLGEDMRAAILGISHITKGTTGRDPIERITGSGAFTALPRLVWCTAKSSDLNKPRRLVRIKSNVGPDGGGFEYELQQSLVDVERGVFGQCILWGEMLEGDARNLIAEVETPDEPGNASALDAAKAWLPEILGTGIVAVTYVQDAAREKGHAWATVQRAKRALEVASLKTGTDGGWAWQMPKVIKDAEGDQH
ncbi:MAG TPA: AAA family ATPase [Rhizomicrobium sp.]|jgi:hypothetical protein